MRPVSPPVGSAHGAMLVYALLISTSFPIGAYLGGRVDPVVVTFFRFLLAAGLFALILRHRSGRLRLPAPARLLRYWLISLTMVVYFVLMFEALKFTTPVKAGAIFTLLPLASGGIGFLLLGIAISRTKLAVLLLGSLGALWVLFDGSLASLLAFDFQKGEVIMTLATLSFAAYAPLVRKLCPDEEVLPLTFWVLVMGALSLGLYGAPLILGFSVLEAGYMAAGLIIWLAVFNTGLTFFLMKYSNPRLPPANIMAYTYLIPAFVVLFSAFQTGLPALSVMAGIAVTFSAMILLWRLG